jgi:porin
MRLRTLTACTVAVCAVAFGEDNTAMAPLMSPNEVGNQIALDREANPLYESRLLAPVRTWRDDLAAKTGLNLALDYSALWMGVNDSPGESSAGSGMVRFFGFWDLVGRDGPNKGSLNWKIENRHRYTEIPVSALGFESGYAGLFGAPFSGQGNRLTLLNWKQYFADGRWAAAGGFLDVTDYVDVYLLATPWLGFANFAFSTGSGAMDLPNDATLGAAAGGMVAGNGYVHAGVSDANSDPTDPIDGFDSVADDGDFFKWLEIGLTPGQDKLYFDNMHLTLWHVDERTNGTPDGWGLNGSWQHWIDDKWLPFVRGGYTEDSGSLMERALVAGVGYQPVPMRGVIGVALHWGKPNKVSFGEVDDQVTGEVFWRCQLTRELAITPTLQYVNNPALDPDEDGVWAFGLRARVAL